jgi:uncharacterized protein (TIGR00266 family)
MSPAEAPACIVCGSPLAGPLSYQVVGTTMPIVEVTLDPGQKIYAETGSLGWMTDDVQMNTVIQGSPWAMLGRAVSGMTPLVTQFTSPNTTGIVAFTTRVPGQIMPLNVDREHEYVMQSGSFLVAQESVSVTAFFHMKLGAVLFGGEGFILQKLRGQGTVFVKIDGEVVEYELAPGQVLLADPGTVAVFESTVGFSIRRVRGITNILFSEGLFLAELRGPGHVYLQTMPFEKLVAQIQTRIAQNTAGSGAVLGSAARAIDGGLGGGLGDVVGGLLGGG